jgi:hypothetical protein
MSKCGGIHCPGCGNGGGGLVAGVIALVVVVVVVRAVLSAIAAAFDAMVPVLEVIGYTLASTLGLAAVSGVVYGGYRVNRALRRRAVARPLRVVSVRPAGLAGTGDGAELAALEEARTAPPGWPAGWRSGRAAR